MAWIAPRKAFGQVAGGSGQSVVLALGYANVAGACLFGLLVHHVGQQVTGEDPVNVPRGVTEADLDRARVF